MTIHPTALLAIVLMAAVTYLTRAGGYWLLGRFALSPRLEAGLGYLPGSVFIALVVPAAIEEGPPGAIAIAITAIVMRRTGNLLLTMI
ncbi:MAG: Msl1536 protein, partial [uncultured Thermomicrobiales bacterium]